MYLGLDLIDPRSSCSLFLSRFCSSVVAVVDSFQSDVSFLCEIMNSKNVIEAGGFQGANFTGCIVKDNTFNIGQSDPPIDIVKIQYRYKKWILAEKENSQMRKKLEQLVINGEHCHIKRTLSRNGEELSADVLLNQIPLSETSLVTGPAGSGKSTLAASITVAWAKSSESRFDLVLFLSSLHKMDNLPLHKQLWGEFSSHIEEKDSLKKYEKLIEMKSRILFIIDGIGNKP